MKSILSGSFAVIFSIFASDGFSQSTLTNGLTAFYPFIGNAKDASGNAYDGVVYGATLTEDRFGRANNAYHFDGVSSYIRTERTLPDMQSASMSCWIRYPDYPVPLGYLFMDGDSSSGQDFYLTVGYENSIWSRVKDNTVVGNPLPALTNTWLHVAVVADNNGQSNVLKMWLNGQLLSVSNSLGNANFGHHSQLYIGCLAVSGGLNYRGDIDDFRIYGRALSDAEVEELYLYESSTPPFCSPYAATAVASVVNGFVVEAAVTDGGCGYSEPPLVVFEGGGGTGAAATAIVTNGVVIGIEITNAGKGYTSIPKIAIASPPFVPWVDIEVSAVRVTQHVVLGKRYVLESSSNLSVWTSVGDPFTATQETVTQEFQVDVTGRFFRTRQIP